jgi:Sortase and related acyltransferases
MSTTVRPGTRADLPRIVAIYNHYVEQSVTTFDTEPVTVASRAPWFDGFDGTRHQLFVMTEADVVIGYAYSGAFRARAAYDRSVETSIYLAPGAVGRGLGEALYRRLLAAVDESDVHRAYGVITVPNPASIALHERLGFTEVGRLTECGRKFDRWHDVAILERPAPPRT